MRAVWGAGPEKTRERRVARGFVKLDGGDESRKLSKNEQRGPCSLGIRHLKDEHGKNRDTKWGSGGGGGGKGSGGWLGGGWMVGEVGYAWEVWS